MDIVAPAHPCARDIRRAWSHECRGEQEVRERPAARGGGSADIAWSIYRPGHPDHHRSCASMHPRHTTATDGGSVDVAGAFIDPVILTIAALARPCARRIPVILTIVASASCLSRHTVHPWT
ncbi:MAG: hypothetical protein OQL16_00470 [Gammaproteobacteria bacterium]|nr:hypothetical protein [Gammaproteobacteria bacterium]